MNIQEKSVPGYEKVVFGTDEALGYHGIIVIHSTQLGPAVGGTRYWSYKTDDAALTDGLRLAVEHDAGDGGHGMAPGDGAGRSGEAPRSL